MREVVSTPDAPKAIGPYSQAIKAGRDLSLPPGQVALDPATGQVGAGRTSPRRTGARPEELGRGSPGCGLRVGQGGALCTVFLKSMNDFAAMNEVYGRYFTAAPPPARSTVEVARLPKRRSRGNRRHRSGIIFGINLQNALKQGIPQEQNPWLSSHSE